MLRNKEFNIYILATGLLFAVMCVVGFLISVETGTGITITGLLLITCFIVYTSWRYKEITNLTSYLRKIISGAATFDIRDNREGELSILKNEIFKVTAKLSEQREYLKLDKQRLTDAISDISHQLKTPLTSMQVMLDLLEQPNLPLEKREQFFRNVQQQLERMEWLITSLLKISKLDAGTANFQETNVEIGDLINQSLQPVLIPIELKNINVFIEGDPSITLFVDRNWTAEAIINVVKNAVEHTQEGGEITFRIDDNPLFTELIIEDNGKGIAKEDMPHLFKRFYKGKNANDTSVGIGLALSYSIITSHNGTIEVQRGKAVGTIFRMKWYRK